MILNKKDIDINEVSELIDFNALFTVSWGFKKKDKELFAKLMCKEAIPNLLHFLEIAKKIVQPKIIYKRCKCTRDSEFLHITYEGKEESLIFTEDAILPKKEAIIYVATIGSESADYANKLKSEDKYKEYLYFHGLCTQLAEAVSEWNHHKLSKNENKIRYSPGYPIWKDLEEQKKLEKILSWKDIGIELSESMQMNPEYSTSGIIVR